MSTPLWRHISSLLMALILLATASPICADDNGFDLAGSLVPAEDIHAGGPPRDGIPAIDAPHFVSAVDADFLQPGDSVLGLRHQGVTRAYPVSAESRRYHPKERVLGVEIDGVFKAYPFAELSRAGKSRIEDRLNGEPLVIEFDWANESARAFSGSGEQLPAVTGFWFAWYAFHPDTEIFTAK